MSETSVETTWLLTRQEAEGEAGVTPRINNVIRAEYPSLELGAQSSWVPLVRPVGTKPFGVPRSCLLPA